MEFIKVEIQTVYGGTEDIFMNIENVVVIRPEGNGASKCLVSMVSGIEYTVTMPYEDFVSSIKKTLSE